MHRFTRIPAFRLGGKMLVAFGAAANYCKDELKTYDVSKGTIRFRAGSPLPKSLVRKLVKTRIAEYAAGNAATKRHPKPRV